jgi:hypothetical protein
VNFEQNKIAFTAKKTGRRILLPLVQPLIDYLSALPSNDNPNAFIFPDAASHKRAASLSNQFHEILVDAGLAEARDYRPTAKSRASAREASEISFHIISGKELRVNSIGTFNATTTFVANPLVQLEPNR